MKLLVLYRPDSDHATIVETFVRDLQRQHDMDGKIELTSADTREGAELAKLYDVWSFPTIVATTDEGQMLNMWQGETLPLMDEVVAYATA